jgi:hypothetical protein
VNYIWVILLFVSYILYSLVIKKLLKEEVRKKNEVKNQIKPIVIEEEAKYNIKEAPFFNMRIMSIFLKLENELEKENLRERFIKILEEAKLRPTYFLLMTLTKPIFFVLIIYTTFYYFLEEQQPILSYITIAVIILSLLKNKKYFFAIIFLVVGLIFYPKIPGTVMLLILMNRLWGLIQEKINKK